jgi:hypothetical protein
MPLPQAKRASEIAASQVMNAAIRLLQMQHAHMMRMRGAA